MLILREVLSTIQNMSMFLYDYCMSMQQQIVVVGVICQKKAVEDKMPGGKTETRSAVVVFLFKG